MIPIECCCSEDLEGGLICCKDCIETEIKNLRWYIKNAVEPLLKHTKKISVFKTEYFVTKEKYKLEIKKKKKSQKKTRGKKRNDVNPKTNKEPVTMDDDELPEDRCRTTHIGNSRTNVRTSFDNRNDNTTDSYTFRMCSGRSDMVWHIVSEAPRLAQGEYKRRHDNVARIIH